MKASSIPRRVNTMQMSIVGFATNDCTKYWSGPLQHATGSCDASSGSPSCRMQCMTETVGGISYEWVNTNQEPSDGCECRRVAGNLTQDEPDMGEFPSSGADYVDENCDGVDGVIEHALFVWAGNTSAGTGTRTNPFRTLDQALASLASSGKRYILVAEGVYDENVVLSEGGEALRRIRAGLFRAGHVAVSDDDPGNLCGGGRRGRHGVGLGAWKWSVNDDRERVPHRGSGHPG